MFTSIIVPLDGSTLSEQALPLACRIAQSTQATIHLVQVHLPVLDVEIAELRLSTVPLIDTTLDRDVRNRERSYLDATRERLIARYNIAVTATICDGPVAAAICDCAASIRADLIVMTTHGRGAVSRFWLGSVADTLVRQSHVPVLLERPAALFAPCEEARPCHILIPLDGSALAESMVEAAIALGTPLQSRYTLLHIIDPVPLASTAPLVYTGAPAPEIARRRERSAQHYLEGIARALRERGLPVDTQVVLSSTPAQAILEQAAQLGVDLIALATHGRSGLTRLLLGSTSDKVLRSAAMPLLLYRPIERPAVMEHDAERTDYLATSAV